MRYTKLDAYFLDTGRIYFCDLYLNLFQIESFHETDISYTTQDGESVMKETTRIRTKSGDEHDIDIPIYDFLKMLEE